MANVYVYTPSQGEDIPFAGLQEACTRRSKGVTKDIATANPSGET